MQQLYTSGLPYSEVVQKNIKSLVKRIKDNKASLVIVDGSIGHGKTTLAVHVADEVNKQHGLPPIDLDLKNHPQLSLGGANFISNLRTCHDKKLPVCIYDEAGDFNKRGALTRFNSMINRTFETFRGFRILIIVVLPSFSVLDNDLLLKGIPRLLLHIKSRSNKSSTIYGYGLYRMSYIKEKMKKLVVKPFAYGLVKPNFYAHSLNLDPKRSKQLDTVSTKGKIEVLKSQEIKIQGLVSYKDIAKKLCRSVVWVKKAVIEKKIKHKKIIARAKFFDDSVIDVLADYGESKRRVK